MSSNEWPLYEVFIRSKSGLSHRHAGSVHAADDQMALQNARDTYTRRSEGVKPVGHSLRQNNCVGPRQQCCVL